MNFNALKKIIGILISIILLTFFSPYYVQAEVKNSIDKLIVDLKNINPDVRERAAAALSSTEDPRVIDALITTLKDEDEYDYVRLSAARSLANMKDLRVVKPLIATLMDNDNRVYRVAFDTLQGKGRKDPRVLELLVDALKHKDPRVRRDIVQMFQSIKNPRVVEPLIAALKDSDPEVRRIASNSLARERDPRVVEPLIAALKDSCDEVRQNAAAGLEYKNDPRVIEPLIAALKDGDAEVRRIAGAVLGNIEDPRAFKPLVALLNDDNSVVREWVSNKLIKIEDPRVLDPLISALKDNDLMIRQNAASILEKRKEDPRLIEPLIAAMKDSDPKVRQSVAYTLAYMKNPHAADRLIAALKDNDTEVRKLALMALRVKEREDPRVVVALKNIDLTVSILETNSLKKKGPGYQCKITGIELVFVKGGCYQMGDIFGGGYTTEKPVHKVCVNDFHVGKYEITQRQWVKIMGSNPSQFLTDTIFNPDESCLKDSNNCPVEQVTWDDVQEFIRKLNFLSGKNYRLPTEAEWEYAARSGGKKEKWAGTSHESSLGDYAWVGGNTNAQTHPVGKKKPNGLGIYDMTGNVAEWCADWLGFEYYKESPRDNPKGPASGSTDESEGGNPPYRVVRGGSWNIIVENTRTTMREGYVPDEGRDTIGFRVVLSSL